MSNFMKVYIVSFVTFMLIDAIWLGVISKNLYKTHIGHLMKPDINWISALVFYLIFIFGLVYFVINPAFEKNSLVYAIYSGALFGLITYATYDLTNLATLKNWPLNVTIIDLFWGSFISSTTSGLSFWIVQKFLTLTN